jgi:hypothetical protein
MGGLLDLIDEEMDKPVSEEPELLTIGDLIREARKHALKPGVHDGKEYYTLVRENGKWHIEATTDRDFQRLKSRGKL